MQVMDNKLFSIEPRGGKLLPGESHTVTLTYRYATLKSVQKKDFGILQSHSVALPYKQMHL